MALCSCWLVHRSHLEQYKHIIKLFCLKNLWLSDLSHGILKVLLINITEFIGACIYFIAHFLECIFFPNCIDCWWRTDLHTNTCRVLMLCWILWNLILCDHDHVKCLFICPPWNKAILVAITWIFFYRILLALMFLWADYNYIVCDVLFWQNIIPVLSKNSQTPLQKRFS